MAALFLLGRLVFGGFFFVSGVKHFTDHATMTAYAASAGVPLPGIAVAVAGLFIVLGGASVILGLRPRVGLALVILFLVPVSLYMHAYWGIADRVMRSMQMANFLKNLALAGAALALAFHPVPWPASVEAARARRLEPVHAR